MNLTLTQAQQIWLDAHIANGEFASVDDALRQLIDARMAEEEFDDLAWAKPLVDEALAQVERRQVMSLEDFNTRMDQHMAKLSRDGSA
jgi:antitoxin ParD1/3/4